MTRRYRTCALALVALAACRERGPLEEPRIHPDQARILCDEDGTTVETPVVAARTDGVHLLVINRLSTDPGFAFEHEGGGGGRNTRPNGTIEHVESIPPGEARVGCWRPMEPDYQRITIVDPDNYFAAMALECESGEMIGGSGGAPGAGITSDREALIDAVREAWSDRLVPEDVVRLAGYPSSPNYTSVAVVRDGDVIARADYLRDFGKWHDDGYSACSEF